MDKELGTELYFVDIVEVEQKFYENWKEYHIDLPGSWWLQVSGLYPILVEMPDFEKILQFNAPLISNVRKIINFTRVTLI